MEAFGFYDTSCLNTEVLIMATKFSSLKVYDDFFTALKANNVSFEKEYNHIETEVLNQVLIQMKSIFNNLFSLEKEGLLNPKVDKSSKLYKLGYRETYFKQFPKKMSLYFSNSAHKKLEKLDQLIHRLEIAVENNRMGFIYLLDRDVDTRVRPCANFLFDNKHLNLVELLKKSPDLKGKLPILEENGLVEIDNNSIILTHKSEVFYDIKSYSNQTSTTDNS